MSGYGYRRLVEPTPEGKALRALRDEIGMTQRHAEIALELEPGDVALLEAGAATVDDWPALLADLRYQASLR